MIRASFCDNPQHGAFSIARRMCGMMYDTCVVNVCVVYAYSCVRAFVRVRRAACVCGVKKKKKFLVQRQVSKRIDAEDSRHGIILALCRHNHRNHDY